MTTINSRLNAPEERERLKQSFLTGTPFQHVVIDNAFSDDLLNKVIDDFSQVRHNAAYADKTTLQKYTCDDWELFPPATYEFISYLNSGSFVAFLSDVTGIQELTSDPYLLGGGMHETLPGGFLKMHTDFNFHKRLKLDRRVNAIIYLNRDWQPSWGGELLLADPKTMKTVAVEPIFNRLVIFNTNDHSFHGHPDAHTFPVGNSRKSIAMYYYANGRPGNEITYQKIGTTYKARRSGDLPLIERLKEAGRLLMGSKGDR